MMIETLESTGRKIEKSIDFHFCWTGQKRGRGRVIYLSHFKIVVLIFLPFPNDKV